MFRTAFGQGCLTGSSTTRRRALVATFALCVNSHELLRSLEKHGEISDFKGKGQGPRTQSKPIPVWDVYGMMCETYKSDPNVFREQTRFDKPDFDRIVEICTPELEKARVIRLGVNPQPTEKRKRGEKRGRKRKLTPHNLVLLTLRWCIRGGALRHLSKEFGLRKAYESVHHCIVAMTLVLSQLHLKWPSHEQQRKMAGFEFIPGSRFRKIVGFLDATPTWCQRGVGNFNGKRKAFCRHSQVVVSLMARIMFIASGFAGGTHDSITWASTSLNKNASELFAPEISLLADSAYQNLDHIVCEKDLQGTQDARVCKDFRASVEHCFGKLKSLFELAETWPGGALRVQAQTMQLMACLYNRLFDLGYLEGAFALKH